jgi:regulator of RNase E activity RraA
MIQKNEIIEILHQEINGTGNIADAIEEVTGARGWMSADMKPIFESKIVGVAETVHLRPRLNNDEREYPNLAIEMLDNAEDGSILVYFLEDSIEIAALGDLMATTAKVRGIRGAVVDGAVRDVVQLKKLGFPVWARRVSPASLVGRMVAVQRNIPVRCAGVIVNPGDFIVADLDGVVVIPKAHIFDVLVKLKQYSEKEEKILKIINEKRSMQKALDQYSRY